MNRALLLATLLVVACQRSSTPAPDPTDPEEPGADAGPTASLRVVDEAGSPGPFRLDDLELLELLVEYQGVRAGSHAARIDAIDPHGMLFAQLPAALVVVAGKPPTTSSVLRVRGTSVDRFHQVGRWRFVVSLDGTSLASGAVDLTE